MLDTHILYTVGERIRFLRVVSYIDGIFRKLGLLPGIHCFLLNLYEL